MLDLIKCYQTSTLQILYFAICHYALLLSIGIVRQKVGTCNSLLNNNLSLGVLVGGLWSFGVLAVFPMFPVFMLS